MGVRGNQRVVGAKLLIESRGSATALLGLHDIKCAVDALQWPVDDKQLTSSFLSSIAATREQCLRKQRA